MAPVLDYNAMRSAGVVQVTNVNTSDTNNVSGNSKEDYSKSLNVDLSVSGSYGAFSGSVSSHFGTSSSSSITNAYNTIQSRIRMTGVRVLSSYVATPTTLRQYLTAAAKAAIDGTNTAFTSPSTLFAAYGTHVLVWGYYGGRLDYNVVTNTSTYTGSTSISACVTAGYDGGIGKVDASASSSFSSDYSNFTNASHTTLNLIGGQSQFGVSDFNSTNFDNWVADFKNPDDQVLCDFETTNGTSLLPIWALCDTSTAAGQARQSALKNAFLTYAASQTNYTGAGGLTVKIYSLYNDNMGYSNPTPWCQYSYNFVGPNEHGNILTVDDSKSEFAEGHYLDLAADGSFTDHYPNSASSFFEATYDLNSLKGFTKFILPVQINSNQSEGEVSDPDLAFYTLTYNSTTDSFSATNPSSALYYFGTDTGNTSTASQVPSQLASTWTLTRGGNEQIVDLVVNNTSGQYLWTKVGFIWN
jgi:hypothetical protein